MVSRGALAALFDQRLTRRDAVSAQVDSRFRRSVHVICWRASASVTRRLILIAGIKSTPRRLERGYPWQFAAPVKRKKIPNYSHNWSRNGLVPVAAPGAWRIAARQSQALDSRADTSRQHQPENPTGPRNRPPSARKMRSVLCATAANDLRITCRAHRPTNPEFEQCAPGTRCRHRVQALSPGR